MRKGILSIFLVLLGSTVLLAQWQQLDQPVGGDVLDMAIKDGTIFISVANIIYKSDDNGASWTDARGNLPAFADINSIGATSSAVYAGVNDGGQGDKFFVSYDDGATWASTGGKGGLNLGIDWENIGDTSFVATNFGAVHRTVDNGVTFEDLDAVGIGNTIDVWGNDLFYLGQGFVRLSTDRGTTVSTPIGTATEITFRFGTMRTAIRIDTVVIAGAQGVFKLDADSVWQKSSTGMPTFLGSATPFVSKLAHLGDLLWAFTNEGIFVSADTADTWNLIENNPTTGFIQRVKIVGNIIHLATKTGYYISDGKTDATVSFERRINGLRHVNVTDLRSFGGDMFIMAPSLGLLKSPDNGETITQFGGNLSTTTFQDLAKATNGFLATDGITLVESTDGAEWTQVSGAPITNAVGANGDVILASSGSQIYKSPDGGANWSAVTQPFQLGAIGPASYAFHDQVIFAAYGTLNTFGAIARSTDGGDTWEATSGAGALTLSPEVVFIDDVAYTPVATTFTGGGVAKSTDFGDTWQILENNLNTEVGGAFELEAVGNTLYTVTVSGIWKSTDGAESWESVDVTGLPSSSFFPGAPLLAHNGDLFYAPGNNSVFKLGGTATSAENESEIAHSFKLDQNYPNPFNPSTSISFSVPTAGMVSLKVYNLLGQEVATLANSPLNAGSHTIHFDASGLSSGVYIYRLQAGANIQTKKMMLIK